MRPDKACPEFSFVIPALEDDDNDAEKRKADLKSAHQSATKVYNVFIRPGPFFP